MKKIKSLLEYTWKYVPIMLVIVLLYTDVAFANNFSKAFNGLMLEYRTIVAGVAGMGALTSLLIFVVHMFQLATLGSAHAMTRRKILNNILISGICTALLGGIGLVYAIIYTSVF